MTGSRELRAGMVACGGIAPLTLEAARRCADFRVVAIQDPDEEALRQVGETHGIPVRCRRIEELLEQELDFVVINSPNHLHREQVEATLHAGLPCLVQKPMAPALAEARAMTRLARERGLALGVMMFEHGKPLHHQLRAMVRAGWLGEPTLVQALMAHDIYYRQPPAEGDWRRDPGKVGGGAFIQLATHQINLARWLLGREIVRIGMLGTRGLTVFEDESAVASALFAGPLAAHFAAGYAARATHFAIAGTRGTLLLTGEHLVLRGEDAYEGELFEYAAPGEECVIPLAALEERSRALEPRYEVHGRFARWLRDGGEFCCTAESALRDMEVLDAAYRSRAEGRFIDLHRGESRCEP